MSTPTLADQLVEVLREAGVERICTDFPYNDFLPGARTVQVDHDASRLGRRTPLELAVHGDLGATLRAVLPLVEQKSDRSFLDRMLHQHAKALEHVVSAYMHDIEHHLPIHPEHAAKILDEVASEDAVFTVDTGMNNVWAARYITPNGRRRVIGSFLHGSMANALPHAIGAQFAYPGRQVISMSGDGGLGMLLGELLTLALHQLPVKVVTFNNSALGMIKLEMMVDGLPDYQTDNGHFDYAAIAEAVGIHAVRVEQPTDLRDGLAEALAHPAPRSSTSSPTPTRSRSRPTSPRARSRASRSPAARPCSTAASGRWSSWHARTCATSRGRRSLLPHAHRRRPRADRTGVRTLHLAEILAGTETDHHDRQAPAASAEAAT